MDGGSGEGYGDAVGDGSPYGYRNRASYGLPDADGGGEGSGTAGEEGDGSANGQGSGYGDPILPLFSQAPTFLPAVGNPFYPAIPPLAMSPPNSGPA